MSGNGISVAEIQRWNADAVRAVFDAAQNRGQAARDASAGLAALDVFDDWGGDTAVAARTSIAVTRADLDAHGHEAMAVAHAAKAAAAGIEAVQARLAALIYTAEQLALQVNPVTSRVEFTDRVTNPVDALSHSLDLQCALNEVLAEADAIDDTLAMAIDMADGDAPIPVIPGPPGQAETRLQNQIEAFTAVFDRPPSSAVDWETAAELDPHSYDPKNRGVAPIVVVGRIQPVPGQGVVRANLFIPSAAVKDPAPWHWPPLDDNAGDNRGFNPAAGPESNRVAVEIDYENGLVAVRQNPSVNVSTGRAQAGTPSVRVAQRRDGSVYIGYAAADPFAPGGEAAGKATVCVRGELVVQPGVDAARVGGVATSFPALEVYHDRPVAPGGPLSTTTIAQRWPPISVGQWGPEMGLPVTLPVGDFWLLPEFKGPAGVIPFLPSPSTELGSAAHPPSVVLLN